jgi:hypothetical protein
MDMPTRPERLADASRTPNALRPEWMVRSWLELMPPRQAQSLGALHAAVMAALPALVPGVKWGNLVYLRQGRLFVTLTPHRQATALALVQQRVARPWERAAGVPAWRFRHGQPIDAEAVAETLRRADRLLR